MSGENEDHRVRIVVGQLAANVVKRMAPHEVDRFDDIATAYFDDPASALSPDGPDETLGYGEGVTLVVAVLVLYVSDKVVDYYLAVMLGRTDAAFRRMFRRRGKPEPRSIDELSPLDPQQEEGARAYIRAGAAKYGLPAMVEQITEAVLAELRGGRETHE
jgi:hypothetical protein